MPLGAEVELDTGDIVLDGIQIPRKGHSSPPLFGSCLLWPKSVGCCAPFRRGSWVPV